MKFIALLNAYSQGISGGDVCFINFAKKVSRKHHFTIITSKLGKKLCKENSVKGNFIISSYEHKFSSPIKTYILRTVQAIRKTINRSTKYDVIYSSSDFLPDVIPAIFLKYKNPKSIWVQKVFHIIPPSRTISHFSQKFSLFLIKQIADLVIFDNPDLEELIKNRHKMNNTITIPPGIDLSIITKTKKTKSRYTAVFMGQLRESKGIFDLVPIWKEVVKKNPEATLGIIGKDINDNSEKIKQQINKESLHKNIKVLGYLEEDVARSLIKSSKVFILPSYEEGFGIVLLESMALGTQPIAYELPVYEVNFPSCIMTAPLGDYHAMADLIVRQINSNKISTFQSTIARYNLSELIKKEYQAIVKLYNHKISKT